MIITIDGPSASGKSSVAKALAKRLNFYYLNTGLLYRAVAYIFTNYKEDLSLVEKISYEYFSEKPIVKFDNADITDKLYDSSLGSVASTLSSRGSVREALLELQRSIDKAHDLVCDGRDCGSVVFPNADYKFFLTASLNVRAMRVKNDSRRKSDLTLDEIKEKIALRDKRDQKRMISPLKIPDGAIVIDNSSMTLDETIDEFERHISK